MAFTSSGPTVCRLGSSLHYEVFTGVTERKQFKFRNQVGILPINIDDLGIIVMNESDLIQLLKSLKQYTCLLHTHSFLLGKFLITHPSAHFSHHGKCRRRITALFAV